MGGGRMRLNLTQRFIVYLIVLSILPLLVVGLSAIHLSNQALEHETRSSAIQQAHDKAALLNGQMAQIEALIANISGVEQIVEAVSAEPPDGDVFTRLATQAQIGYVLNNYINLDGLVSIDIFTLGGSHYHVGDTLVSNNLDVTAREQLIAETLAAPSRIHWAGVQANLNRDSAHRQVVTVARVIRRFDLATSREVPVALLLINYDPHQIRREFSKAGVSEDRLLIVLDGRDRLVYHPDPARLGSHAEPALIAQLAEAHSATVTINAASGVLISQVALHAPGWRLAILVPEETRYRSAQAIGRTTTVAMLVSLLIVGVGAVLFARRVVQPIRDVARRFGQLRDLPDAELLPLAPRGDDEIGNLSRGFNAFLDGLNVRRQSDAKLQLAASVFSHAREGIVITDADGHIIEVNDAFTRITGYPRNEVLGRNPRILSSGRHDRAFYDEMWRDLRTRGYWEGEVWNMRKSGQEYAQSLAIAAVRGSDQQTSHYVALFSDITRQKDNEQQLRHIAHFDPLTGLPNRVLLADRLEQAIVRVRRSGLPLALAYIDLDGFKSVNDVHGHDVGDQLLVTLAARMKDCLREGDTVARLGGDEFVAVLADLSNQSTAKDLIDRLLSVIAQPVKVDGVVVQVSGSIGISHYPQSDDVDPDQLLRQADQAMYQAKVAGKNRYHIFDTARDASLRGQHEHLERIREGLIKNEFVLHYQPKVNMRSGEVIGAEALIRWQHPDQGLLAPVEFLPPIAQHPLEVELGRWVIDTALTQIAAWQDAGVDLPVSVNISGFHLQQAGFLDELRALLAAHPNVPRGYLELEVLESSALEDIALVSAVIDASATLGVSFALDDFGTGYSSLTYLKRLPAQVLKIDQSFVRDMLQDSDDLAILEGILGLATAFRRRAIAEGVETVAHGETLLRLGCDLGQGYGIARPMAAADLPAWRQRWRPDPRWAHAHCLDRELMPVLIAGVEHRGWIVALGEHLDGRRDAPPPLDHHQCRLGQWLDKTIHQPRHAATFATIETLHLRVHALAADLRKRRSQGHDVEALAGMAELHALWDALLVHLEYLLKDDPRSLAPSSGGGSNCR